MILGKITLAELKTNAIVTSGTSSVRLSSLTIKTERFSLTKRNFFDSIYLRYGWEPKNLPKECIRKANYNIGHTLPNRHLHFQN